MIKYKKIQERICYILKILKKNNKISSDRDLIDQISKYLDKEKFELDKYYKQLQNIKSGILKKMPKDISFGLYKTFGINPEYLDCKSDIIFNETAIQLNSFNSICESYKVAYVPIKFNIKNNNLKVDCDIEKYKFVFVKVNSNLIKLLMQINSLNNAKGIKDKNLEIQNLIKEYKNPKTEEYVLIKCNHLTEVIGAANDDMHRLCNIIDIKFLNEINNTTPIENLKKTEYKIDRNKMKEEIKSIEWQIDFYNRRIKNLKKKLKELNNKKRG